jgi:photosystem II stability/assembly factor-like uncharacterized protein
VPTRERVFVWYLAAGPILLLLLALLFGDALFPDSESLNTIAVATSFLIAFAAPVAWVVALVAAVQHRREWRLVLPLALFVLGGVFFTGFVFLGSSLAANCGLALTLLAIGLATCIGWAPVLAAPGNRAHHIRALGAAALRAAGRGTRPLADLAAFTVLIGAISLLFTGAWVQGGVALLVGLAILPVTWRWLSRATGWSVPARARIAAVALLAVAMAATTRQLDQRPPEPVADERAVGELPAKADPPVYWCGVWGSDSTVIVVGPGTIRRSADGGRTWRTSESGTKGYLCGVGGWASTVLVAGQGGTLLRSTDGGTTWSSVGTGSDQDWLQGVWATDSIAIVVGGDRLLRSTDGGGTWSPVRLPRGMRGYALTHVWGDEASIVVASNNGVFRSTDAGRTWSRVWRQRDHDISSVWGSGSTVIGVGSWGTIVRSIDGGAAWTRVLGEKPPPPVREPDGTVVYHGSSLDFEGVAGSGATVVAVGTNGAVVRSTDGGATWNEVASGTMQNLSTIWGSDSLFVAVGSAGTILVSRDGGRDWAPADSSLAGRVLVAVAGSPAALIAVGPHGTVGRSKDAGVTWTATTGSWTSKHLNGVWAQGSTAFAVGHGGTILRTVDGGESWTATTMEIPRGVLRPETEGRPALADRQDAALRADRRSARHHPALDRRRRELGSRRQRDAPQPGRRVDLRSRRRGRGQRRNNRMVGRRWRHVGRRTGRDGGSPESGAGRRRGPGGRRARWHHPALDRRGRDMGARGRWNDRRPGGNLGSRRSPAGRRVGRDDPPVFGWRSHLDPRDGRAVA